MTKNMGSADRIFRTLVAVVFAVLFFTGTVTGIFGWALVIFGGVFLATSFISFCPLYTIFGWNTCSRK